MEIHAPEGRSLIHNSYNSLWQVIWCTQSRTMTISRKRYWQLCQVYLISNPQGPRSFCYMIRIS
uniref:Protein TOPLESS isoform X1 n=1 Tax=Rhizophora mucronata TaxID=61149 RepID=A0A2P2JNU8_RHIMU